METLIVALVDIVTAPIVLVIPFLASTGILAATFAALWIGFGVLLVRDPARLDATWSRLRRLPLVVQGLAWLLLLPVLAGLWMWRTRWPIVARLTLIAGLAGWNVLVMLPHPA